jgi:hypothetical protein
VSGFFSSIVGKLKGEEEEEPTGTEDEAREEEGFTSLMSDDTVPKKLVRRIVYTPLPSIFALLLNSVRSLSATQVLTWSSVTQDAGGEVNHIQHSSQGSMFATSGVEGNIIIWDTLSSAYREDPGLAHIRRV